MRRRLSPDLRRVQVRTTATAMVGVVVILVAVGIGLVRLFERNQLDQVDARLEEVYDLLQRSGGAPAGGEAGPDTYAQIVDETGAVEFNGPPLDDAPALIDPAEVAGQDFVLRTVDAGDAGRLRTINFPLDDSGRILVFGYPTAPVDEAVDTLVRTLVIGLPFAAAGLFGLVWLVVGRTLRPVDEAMSREKRLVADAGHDLRSPLAGVRALLETEPSDPVELEQNRLDALATLARLEAIAENLLLLAQTDGSRPALAGARAVDVDELVLRQVRLLPDTAVRVDTSQVSAGQVVGHETDLERLVENLLANALRHARSEVAVALREHDGQVTLVVGDDGPGIPAEERERVFERFTRLDESRTADGAGAGLGLAIVRAVAVEHGGTVSIGTSPLGGAQLEVVLPASLTGQALEPV